jgi:glucokinase
LSTAGAVGVDIGGTKLLPVRLGSGGSIEEGPQVPAPRDATELAAQVRAAAAALSPHGPAPALGVGVPGLVDAAGRLVFAPNLPGAAGAELARALAGAARRIWVGNDATAAAWAEHQMGAGRGSSHMLMVTLGTGIGGGIVTAGRLDEGAHRFAGEFGHMVVNPGGIQCPCGKRGCWERYASGAGLGTIGRELAVAGAAPGVVARAGGDPEAVRGEHVSAAAAAGDADALEAVRRFGWWVGLGLANLANLFDPEVIVVGGGLVSAGEVLLGPIREAFAELVEAADRRPVARIEAAVLGPRAGAVGAALLATGQPEAVGPSAPATGPG